MQVAEGGYQRNAWAILVIIGIISMIFGAASILASLQSTNPNSPTQVTQRDEGVVIIGFGLFGSAISYKPFRRGEKWAWYVALYVPIAFVYLTYNSYSSGGSNWPFFIVLLLLDLIGLFLPFRKFFPKK
jgi:cell division protein FtsW (lipid II flippase)